MPLSVQSTNWFVLFFFILQTYSWSPMPSLTVLDLLLLSSFAIVLRTPFSSVCVGFLHPEPYTFIFLGLLYFLWLGGVYLPGTFSGKCINKNFSQNNTCLKMSVVFWLGLEFQVENVFWNLEGFASLASHSTVRADIHNDIFTLGHLYVYTPASVRIFSLIPMWTFHSNGLRCWMVFSLEWTRQMVFVHSLNWTFT